MSTRRCPKCKKLYTLGVNGIYTGCDECLHIKRDKNGYAWKPSESKHIYKDNTGRVSVVRRKDAGLRGEK